jgi:flagella synthesis protein FlgN
VSNPVDRLVAKLLRDETAALHEFVAVLQEEQNALASGQLDELLPLAKNKGELAGRLSALDDERLRAIGAGQGSDHAKKMTAWLESSPDPTLAAAWLALLGLAARAREINTTNGNLIAERMRHNQKALAILVAAGDTASLYGPDGQPRLGGSGRVLGSA